MPSLPCPLGTRCKDGVDGRTWESVDVDFDQARKLVEDHYIAAHQASQPLVIQIIDEEPLSAEDQLAKTLGSTEASVSVWCPHCKSQITTEVTTVVGVRSKFWIESWLCALVPIFTLCCCYWHLFSIHEFKDIDHKCPHCERILGSGHMYPWGEAPTPSYMILCSQR